MKNALVLIVTIFFIMALSALVLINLNDTEKYIKKEHYIFNNTQTISAVKNIKDEILKAISSNQEGFEKFIKQNDFDEFIPLENEDLTVSFKVKKYEKININDIQTVDIKKVEEFFVDNHIYDFALFVDVYKELLNDTKEVTSRNQLDFLINVFIEKSLNEEILQHKDYIGFLNKEDLYELFVKVDYLDSKAQAYYVLSNQDKKVEVKYFDISFE